VKIIEKDGGLVVENGGSKKTWTSKSLGDWRAGPPARKTYRLIVDPTGEPLAIIGPDGERGYVPSGSARAEKHVRTALALTVNAERRDRRLTNAERDVIEAHVRTALDLVGLDGVKRLGDKLRATPDGIGVNGLDGMRGYDLRVTVTVDPRDAALKRKLDELDPPVEADADEEQRLRLIGRTLSVTESAGPAPTTISQVIR
jgi:hypothetical protein